MPGFDRTGPMGAGPMTGGRRGYCHPASAGFLPAYGRYGYGRGLRRGRGFRSGCGFGPGREYGGGYGWYPPAVDPFYPPVYPVAAASEIDMLQAQADYLKNAMEAVNQRIDALKKQSS